jgi:hypothetical protein
MAGIRERESGWASGDAAILVAGLRLPQLECC